ncbi:MAG: hypothetical protein ACM3NR_03215 [Methanosarcina sp.]
MNEINVLNEFLNYPLASANPILDRFSELKGSIRRGEGAEQFVYIGGKRENRVLLVAHADTVWDLNDNTIQSDHDIIYNNGIFSSDTPGVGIGADDRAGCAILWLLKDLGHSFLITNGEEQGRLGSKWLMDYNDDIAEEINFSHRFAVQFDRRNKNDYKCYNVGTPEFRKYLNRVTGYREPDTSSYTDIVTVCRRITGVNLSIGYYHEHSEEERLVVREWLNTLEMSRRWLGKEYLPSFSRREYAVSNI